MSKKIDLNGIATALGAMNSRSAAAEQKAQNATQQLAAAQAEIAQLKAAPPATPPGSVAPTTPTPEQAEAKRRADLETWVAEAPTTQARAFRQLFARHANAVPNVRDAK